MAESSELQCVAGGGEGGVHGLAVGTETLTQVSRMTTANPNPNPNPNPSPNPKPSPNPNPSPSPYPSRRSRA